MLTIWSMFGTPGITSRSFTHVDERDVAARKATWLEGAIGKHLIFPALLRLLQQQHHTLHCYIRGALWSCTPLTNSFACIETRGNYNQSVWGRSCCSAARSFGWLRCSSHTRCRFGVHCSVEVSLLASRARHWPGPPGRVCAADWEETGGDEVCWGWGGQLLWHISGNTAKHHATVMCFGITWFWCILFLHPMEPTSQNGPQRCLPLLRETSLSAFIKCCQKQMLAPLKEGEMRRSRRTMGSSPQ